MQMYFVCRTCLKTGTDYFNLFNYFENSKALSQMLMECATVKIEEGDGLPYHICCECRGKLNSLWAFKTMVLNSESKLRNNINVPELPDNTAVKEEPSVGGDDNIDPISNVNENTNNNNRRAVGQSKCLDSQILRSIPSLSNVNVIYQKCETVVEFEHKSICDIVKELDQKDIIDVDCMDTNLNQCSDDKSGIKTFHLEEKLNAADHKVPVDSQNLKECQSNKCVAGNSKKLSKFIRKQRRGRQIKKEKSPSKLHKISVSQKYCQNQLECKICNQTFDTLYSLKKHRKIYKHQKYKTAQQNKKFLCKLCGEDMQTQYKLSIHQASHKGESYECHVCQRIFPLKSSLIAHEKRHLNDVESRLICELCGKSFANIYTLKYHRLTHNTEKNIPCPTCGKLFTTQKNMMAHFAWHNIRDRHICEYCNKGFKTANRKKRHILIHTGEKPHPCKICDKRFTDSGTLSRHMLTHTGETKFACDKCLYKCRYKQQFDKHLRKHK